MPINKIRHKYFCLRKGRFYLKSLGGNGGGNLISENLPISDHIRYHLDIKNYNFEESASGIGESLKVPITQ